MGFGTKRNKRFLMKAAGLGVDFFEITAASMNFLEVAIIGIFILA